MKTPYQAALVLALATPAMPALAFYHVVEETARLEIAPGDVKSEHLDHSAWPIPSIDERGGYTFEQTLETATSSQHVFAGHERSVPGRRGEVHHLVLEAWAYASGTTLSNITQKVDYEVVFDIFNFSFFSIVNSSVLTLEKVAPDNSRQLVAFAPAASDDPYYYYYNDRLGTFSPGRYAVTMSLAFSPSDDQLAQGMARSLSSSVQVFNTAVPEPGSWALVWAGIFGVAALRHLQRPKT